jgi:RNA binding exosome subunit
VNQALNINVVRISVHAHPTEIVENVKQSLANLLGLDMVALDPLLESSVFDGDYGNKIHVLNVVLKSPKDIAAFMQSLKDRIPDDHKRLIRAHFESFYNPDNKTFYIRFHKQLAFEGQLRVSQYDDILHASIKFTAYTRHATGDDGQNIQKFLLDQGIIA